MKRKRKQKKQDFNNLEIHTELSPYCPNLRAKFSFVKSTPIKFSLRKLGAMSFRLIDKTWEKYGVARVYDITHSTRTPILECWYPSNVIRCESPEVFQSVWDAFRQPAPERIAQFKEPEDGVMTFLGSTFMRTVGIATGRECEYQIYMNSVSPIQIPIGT